MRPLPVTTVSAVMPRASQPASTTTIPTSLIDAVAARLRENKQVRRHLPEGGRLHIDRQLPFLCLYCRRPDAANRGMERLASGQASYLIAPLQAELEADVAKLVQRIIETLVEPFGAFLVLELAPMPAEEQEEEALRFRISAPRRRRLGPFVDLLRDELLRISVRSLEARVEVVSSDGGAGGRGPSPVIPRPGARDRSLAVLRLEVSPIFCDPRSGRVHQDVLRELSRPLRIALMRTFYDFSCRWTRTCPLDYHMLGRRAVVKAVWKVDRELAAVGDRFDVLFQATPVNTPEAWETFRRNRYQRTPSFRYRPLAVQPSLLKRRLWSVPMQGIEDPTLEDLFRDKQDELDRQLNLLIDIDRPAFVHDSVQVFGGVSGELLQLAQQLLASCPWGSGRDDTTGGRVDAHAFAAAARAEIETFRQQWPGIEARVEVRDDIARGLLVSKGNLLIGKRTRIPAARVDALIQHEVGTHVLTYHNGRAQPLRQLYGGLPGYDALQEGLAVLSEYLIGGLSLPRLRLLAARVLATHAMLSGGTFVDSFRLLTRSHGFQPRTAFNVTMRIFRGGGLTKDAAYLRGLAEALEYLAEGGEIEPLLIGKISSQHLPIIRELRLRGVLREPPLRPRVLRAPRALLRGRRVRDGMSVLDLVAEVGRQPGARSRRRRAR